MKGNKPAFKWREIRRERKIKVVSKESKGLGFLTTGKLLRETKKLSLPNSIRKVEVVVVGGGEGEACTNRD